MQPTKIDVGKIRSLLLEFKEFALRGNAFDLAVGVVIGAAFGSVVNSLVQDVIMPPIGMLTGGIDFKDKRIIFRPQILGADGKVLQTENALRWGMFLNNVISLLIVAASIFLVIKLINMLHRKPADPPPAEPVLTPDQQLLTEIRDLLKTRDGSKPTG
ncbi:MAG: large-conductance mechanosensitive channel protein MscL [Tepidisphaeraceae bacterium]